MDTVRHTFGKEEKLCSVRIIEQLFDKGKIIHFSFFKLVWIYAEGLPSPAQIAFSVTKRSFKSAVTRNLIKRRMREAYRKNKDPLYRKLNETGRQVAMMVILKNQNIPDYSATEQAMKGILERLIIALNQPDKC